MTEGVPFDPTPPGSNNPRGNEICSETFQPVGPTLGSAENFKLIKSNQEGFHSKASPERLPGT